MSEIVLLTGAGGFIGRHMARVFASAGWRVVGIDLAPPENAPMASLSRYVQARLPYPGLIDVLKEENPTICVHCAGSASVGLSLEDPAADFEVGPALTFDLLDALRRYTPGCRILFLSSAAVYGQPEGLPVSESARTEPISPYGFHKLQCELLCREFWSVFGLRTCCLRIFSAYGPGLRRQVVWDVCHQLITKGTLRLQGTGFESRDFIHVRDIVEAARVVLDQGEMKGESYNVASGVEVTIRYLAENIADMLGMKVEAEFNGIVPVGTPLHWRANTQKLRGLGFNPVVGLEEGLRASANWCRSEISAL